MVLSSGTLTSIWFYSDWVIVAADGPTKNSNSTVFTDTLLFDPPPAISNKNCIMEVHVLTLRGAFVAGTNYPSFTLQIEGPTYQSSAVVAHADYTNTPDTTRPAYQLATITAGDEATLQSVPMAVYISAGPKAWKIILSRESTEADLPAGLFSAQIAVSFVPLE